MLKHLDGVFVVVVLRKASSFGDASLEVTFLIKDTYSHIPFPFKIYEWYIIIIPIFTREKPGPFEVKERA